MSTCHVFIIWTILSLISNGINTQNKNQRKPNIVLIVMDDLGFNDVPWHDHTNTQMPFLNKFVRENALQIDTFYTLPLCSMTRSALLTGRYPMRYGLQSSVIENGYPFGLSTLETLLSNDLQNEGYKTYAIGKWHLGFHRPDLLPLHRGFDEFRGSLSPMIHYFGYDYTVQRNNKAFKGFDLYINNEPISPVTDTNRQYLTDWEGEQFIDILDKIALENENENENGKENNPFFMYVAMHASHDPREATNECLDLYYETYCMNRAFEPLMDCEMHQIMQAQTSCVDQTLQEMITHLQSVNDGQIWDNTLLIWLSDNGAPPMSGDNSPLRGAKKELFEGGVRTIAFISGGHLNADRYGQIFDTHTPFHVVDVYPTILSAIGILDTVTQRTDRLLDGLDQWNAINNGIINPELSGDKREFLYNVDPKDCETVMCGAYRYGNYKFIWTQNTAPDMMYWYDFFASHPRKDENGAINGEYTNYLNCENIPKGVKQENERGINGEYIGSLPCGDKPCVFDIGTDPCEYMDLSNDIRYENLYLYMYNMLMAYYDIQQLPLRVYFGDKFDENSDPNAVGKNGYWAPWMSEYKSEGSNVYFEDLLSENENCLRSQNVRMSQYYEIAMEYKRIWEQQRVNEMERGLVSDESVIDTFGDGMHRNENVLRNLKVLMFITVIITVVIVVGCVTLCVKWSQGCCHDTKYRNDEWLAVDGSQHCNVNIVRKPLIINKLSAQLI